MSPTGRTKQDSGIEIGLPPRTPIRKRKTCILGCQIPKKRWKKDFEEETADELIQNPGPSTSTVLSGTFKGSCTSPVDDLNSLPLDLTMPRVENKQMQMASTPMSPAPSLAQKTPTGINPGYSSFSIQSVLAMQSASFPGSSTSSVCDNHRVPMGFSMTGAENKQTQMAPMVFTALLQAGEAEQSASPAPSPAQKTPRSINPGYSSFSIQSVLAMQSASFPGSSMLSVCDDNSMPMGFSVNGAENKQTQMAPMVLAAPLQAGETEQSASPAPSPAQKTPRSSPAGICEVCKEPATGNHYRVVTCEGCKGFWKRTIQYLKEHNLKEPRYTCRNGTKDCSVIGKENRKTCQYCRFQACINAKMDTNNVMNSEQRNIHNEKKRQNRENRLNKRRQSSVSEEQQILTNKVKEIYNDVRNRRLEMQNMPALDNECPLSQDVAFCFEFGRELLSKVLPEKSPLKVTRELIEQKLREHGDRLVITFILGSYKRVNNEGSEYTLQFSSRRYTEAEVDALPERKRKVCKPFFTAISHFTRCFKGFRETDEHILVLAMALTILTGASWNSKCVHTEAILSKFENLAVIILTTVNDLTNNLKAKPIAAPIFCSYHSQATIPSSVQMWKDDQDNQDSYEAYKQCSEAVLRDLFT